MSLIGKIKKWAEIAPGERMHQRKYECYKQELLNFKSKEEDELTMMYIDSKIKLEHKKRIGVIVAIFVIIALTGIWYSFLSMMGNISIYTNNFMAELTESAQITEIEIAEFVILLILIIAAFISSLILMFFWFCMDSIKQLSRRVMIIEEVRDELYEIGSGKGVSEFLL